jgi:hypothetical protein
MNELGTAVGIQIGDAKPEVYSDLSIDEVASLITKHDARLAERLKAAEERIQAIQDEVVGNPDLTVEYFLLQREQSKADHLFSCDLQDFDPEAHSKRVDQYHRYSGVGSALLYADRGFKGSSKFFSVTWPNFKWWPYKFNDKASSAKAWGGNILFQHTWYGGRPLYLIGLPYVEFSDLGVFGFNDMASSFVSVP